MVFIFNFITAFSCFCNRRVHSLGCRFVLCYGFSDSVFLINMILKLIIYDNFTFNDIKFACETYPSRFLYNSGILVQTLLCLTFLRFYNKNGFIGRVLRLLTLKPPPKYAHKCILRDSRLIFRLKSQHKSVYHSHFHSYNSLKNVFS